MRTRRREMIKHADDIIREIPEAAGAVVVIRFAIAARIPGHRMKTPGEIWNLRAPVFLSAADAMQEQHKGSLACSYDRDRRI